MGLWVPGSRRVLVAVGDTTFVIFDLKPALNQPTFNLPYKPTLGHSKLSLAARAPSEELPSPPTPAFPMPRSVPTLFQAGGDDGEPRGRRRHGHQLAPAAS